MKKNRDITKPRYGEHYICCQSLAFRFVRSSPSSKVFPPMISQAVMAHRFCHLGAREEQLSWFLP